MVALQVGNRQALGGKSSRDAVQPDVSSTNVRIDYARQPGRTRGRNSADEELIENFRNKAAGNLSDGTIKNAAADLRRLSARLTQSVFSSGNLSTVRTSGPSLARKVARRQSLSERGVNPIESYDRVRALQDPHVRQHPAAVKLHDDGLLVPSRLLIRHREERARLFPEFAHCRCEQPDLEALSPESAAKHESRQNQITRAGGHNEEGGCSGCRSES